MSLQLDPLALDEAAPAVDGDELPRLLAALAGGDAAFALTLVERFGAVIAAELRAAGAPVVDLDARVHDVALALLGAPVDPADRPWAVVRRAVERVARRGSPGTHLRCRAGVLPPPAPEPWARARTTTGATSSRGRSPEPCARARTLHLVDIENLAGGPRRAAQCFGRALREFEEAAEVAEEDQVVMAADVNLWKRTAFDVERGRYLVGFGRDGADRVLLQEARVDWVVERFERLVVGSGDHAFAPLARQVRRRGLEVVVVARSGSLAGALRWEATRVELLPALAAA